MAGRAVSWHTSCFIMLARFEYSELQEAETIVACVPGKVRHGCHGDFFARELRAGARGAEQPLPRFAVGPMIVFP